MGNNQDDSKGDELDDFFENVGIDVLQGRTPEQMLYNDVTAGKMPTIANARYWLDHELSLYMSLASSGYHIRYSTRDGHAIISMDKLAREMLRYYFLMTKHTSIYGTGSRPPCDLDKFLDLIIPHEVIRKTIDKHIANRLP